MILRMKFSGNDWIPTSGGLKIIRWGCFLGGVEIFSGGIGIFLGRVEIFSGGVEIFLGGVRIFHDMHKNDLDV